MTEFSKSNWAKISFAEQYRENADIYIIERQRMLEIMKSFYLNFVAGESNKILDLGCGDGILTDNLFSIDPTISATLIDASQEMLDRAGERLSEKENVKFICDSFQNIMKQELAERDYDFIVSSMAIHHLTMSEKRALFKMIHSHLKCGGYFMNIDVLIAPTTSLEEWYMRIWEEWMDDKRTQIMIFDEPSIEVIKRYKNAEENQPDTLEQQLNYLNEIGFNEIDCYYKYGIFAVYGGRKEEKTYFPDI